MILILLELIFPILLVIIPALIKDSKRPFISKFKVRMLRSVPTRKFVIQMFVLTLLLFHFIYTNVQGINVGVLLSTVICFVLLSNKTTLKLFNYINQDRQRFVHFEVLSMAIAFVPELCTVSYTFALSLLVSSLYPEIEGNKKNKTSNDIHPINLK